MSEPSTVRHITPGSTVPPLPSPESAATASGALGRAGRPLSAVDHVADFYGAYTDALRDRGRGRGRGQLADALRHHYLTPEFRRSLISWEAVHDRDGVLRARGVPAAWRVVYDNSGTGHCWSRVTLVWEDDENRPYRTTRLLVRSDTATRRICGIRSLGTSDAVDAP